MDSPSRLPMQGWIYAAALLVLGAAFSFAWAQNTGSHEPKRDRARTVLMLRLVEALELNEEQALRISRLLRDSEQRRQTLQIQRRNLEDKIRREVASTTADLSRLTQLVTEANTLDEQLALAAEQAIHTIQKCLTVPQQAKLVLVRHELLQQVKQTLRRRLERPPQR